jgi:formylglycine-generating enzyme required for sulfatase activity
MSEWVLDWNDGTWYSSEEGVSCTDCANLTSKPVNRRGIRGGHYQAARSRLQTFWRQGWAPQDGFVQIGIRCAR